MGKRKSTSSENHHSSDENSQSLKASRKEQKRKNKNLIVILERANVTIARGMKNCELLTCDHSADFIKKLKKNIDNCRPDILHQCLLMLQDSPLNQAGFLQVYIHTEENKWIAIDPECRIPRTFKRFSGLIAQLITSKHSAVKSTDGSKNLLEIIDSPLLGDRIPPNCTTICTSYDSPKCVDPSQLPKMAEENPLVIVVGAMALGKVEVDYTSETLAISQYHLSGALTCSKICTAFEESWDVL